MLVIDRVRRSFGSVEAVRDVSFSVAAGSIFGLLGPNGAGKTTTMRMILGIYPPDAGAVRWHGAPVDRVIRRRFGYLPEERGLYARMRVRDQIVYFGRLHGLARDDAMRRTDRWIDRLGIGELARRPAGELSKGNQQRVQLACAAVHDPEVLVLDEPFSGLDPVNASALLAIFREIAAAGTTLVLSSHQMWQIEDAASAFCIIAAGRVCASGSLAELRSAFPTRVVRVAPDLPEVRALFAGYGAEPPAGELGELSYEMPATTDFGGLLRAVAAAAPIEKFERREPSLQQIYLRAIA